MPLYEYQCEKCHERFEVMQKFSDAPLTTHEKCGGPVHRLLSAPALQFKGSGWYITDYARSGKKSAENGSDKTDKAAGSSSGESKPAASSSETKSETKSSTSETK